jgi:hypothetical protein
MQALPIEGRLIYYDRVDRKLNIYTDMFIQ